MQIVIIGGGAAGFFGAINTAIRFPECNVLILEKSDKVLAKVRVSGGGRCNVTHACFQNNELVKNYPRGEKQLLSVFSRFTVEDVIKWFEERKVKLKTEADGRMFPVSNNSMTIVNCFLDEVARLGIKLRTGCSVKGIKRTGTSFEIMIANNEKIIADRILIATGGNSKEGSYEWLKALGHTIISPVPSLFTFNSTEKKIRELMGLSVDMAMISIKGSKFENCGPLLITHWGFSGPAVLKLSSLAARYLNDKKYEFDIELNWLGNEFSSKIPEIIKELKLSAGSKTVHSSGRFDLPNRLWKYLADRAGINEKLNWADLTNDKIESLKKILARDVYSVSGKTTYKEEFVTCGGIASDEVDFRTMESRKIKGLFFSGEVLDIDGITGGFNFQSAWSTAMVASGCIGL